MREAAKIASHSRSTASVSGRSGNTVRAQAGVAQATMFQLMAKLVISSSEGRLAREAARLARDTLSGSSALSSDGSSPLIAIRAALPRNALAIPSDSQPEATSNASSGA